MSRDTFSPRALARWQETKSSRACGTRLTWHQGSIATVAVSSVRPGTPQTSQQWLSGWKTVRCLLSSTLWPLPPSTPKVIQDSPSSPSQSREPETRREPVPPATRSPAPAETPPTQPTSEARSPAGPSASPPPRRPKSSPSTSMVTPPSSRTKASPSHSAAPPELSSERPPPPEPSPTTTLTPKSRWSAAC